MPEQAAHQLVDGGRRAGAEGPRFGGRLGEDVLVQVLEGLTPRSGLSVESRQVPHRWICGRQRRL
ncbi:hypothetical protein AB4225_35380 [Streptomyces sp. 2RAF24]|uniref:hypothetical protein n=1 Tax=Streptomyces sp. 2RAF24 TaxID=3232997 RepID=UPI003F982B3A